MPRLGTKQLYYLLQEDLRVLGLGRYMLFKSLGANHMLIVTQASYHNVSDSQDIKGSVRALKMAIKTKCYKPSTLVHHSDGGLQYYSNQYQAILKKSKLGCSMAEFYDPLHKLALI
jgi:hypothetical protein